MKIQVYFGVSVWQISYPNGLISSRLVRLQVLTRSEVFFSKYKDMASGFHTAHGTMTGLKGTAATSGIFTFLTLWRFSFINLFQTFLFWLDITGTLNRFNVSYVLYFNYSVSNFTHTRKEGGTTTSIRFAVMKIHIT